MKTIYIAGPMTGVEAFNYPLFNSEAARIRALGYTVENPAEGPVCDSWEAYMRNAIGQLIKCDTVALLPQWRNSRGACVEVDLALGLGMFITFASMVQRRTS